MTETPSSKAGGSSSSVASSDVLSDASQAPRMPSNVQVESLNPPSGLPPHQGFSNACFASDTQPSALGHPHRLDERLANARHTSGVTVDYRLSSASPAPQSHLVPPGGYRVVYPPPGPHGARRQGDTQVQMPVRQTHPSYSIASSGGAHSASTRPQYYLQPGNPYSFDPEFGIPRGTHPNHPPTFLPYPFASSHTQQVSILPRRDRAEVRSSTPSTRESSLPPSEERRLAFNIDPREAWEDLHSALPEDVLAQFGSLDGTIEESDEVAAATQAPIAQSGPRTPSPAPSAPSQPKDASALADDAPLPPSSPAAKGITAQRVSQFEWDDGHPWVPPSRQGSSTPAPNSDLKAQLFGTPTTPTPRGRSTCANQSSTDEESDLDTPVAKAFNAMGSQKTSAPLTPSGGEGEEEGEEGGDEDGKDDEDEGMEEGDRHESGDADADGDIESEDADDVALAQGRPPKEVTELAIATARDIHKTIVTVSKQMNRPTSFLLRKLNLLLPGGKVIIRPSEWSKYVGYFHRHAEERERLGNVNLRDATKHHFNSFKEFYGDSYADILDTDFTLSKSKIHSNIGERQRAFTSYCNNVVDLVTSAEMLGFESVFAACGSIVNEDGSLGTFYQTNHLSGFLSKLSRNGMTSDSFLRQMKAQSFHAHAEEYNSEGEDEVEPMSEAEAGDAMKVDSLAPESDSFVKLVKTQLKNKHHIDFATDVRSKTPSQIRRLPMDPLRIYIFKYCSLYLALIGGSMGGRKTMPWNAQLLKVLATQGIAVINWPEGVQLLGGGKTGSVGLRGLGVASVRDIAVALYEGKMEWVRRDTEAMVSNKLPVVEGAAPGLSSSDSRGRRLFMDQTVDLKGARRPHAASSKKKTSDPEPKEQSEQAKPSTRSKAKGKSKQETSHLTDDDQPLAPAPKSKNKKVEHIPLPNRRTIRFVDDSDDEHFSPDSGDETESPRHRRRVQSIPSDDDLFVSSSDEEGSKPKGQKKATGKVESAADAQTGGEGLDKSTKTSSAGVSKHNLQKTLAASAQKVHAKEPSAPVKESVRASTKKGKGKEPKSSTKKGKSAEQASKRPREMSTEPASRAKVSKLGTEGRRSSDMPTDETTPLSLTAEVPTMHKAASAAPRMHDHAPTGHPSTLQTSNYVPAAPPVPTMQTLYQAPVAGPFPANATNVKPPAVPRPVPRQLLPPYYHDDAGNMDLDSVFQIRRKRKSDPSTEAQAQQLENRDKRARVAPAPTFIPVPPARPSGSPSIMHQQFHHPQAGSSSMQHLPSSSSTPTPGSASLPSHHPHDPRYDPSIHPAPQHSHPVYYMPGTPYIQGPGYGYRQNQGGYVVYSPGPYASDYEYDDGYDQHYQPPNRSTQ